MTASNPASAEATSSTVALAASDLDGPPRSRHGARTFRAFLAWLWESCLHCASASLRAILYLLSARPILIREYPTR